MINLKTAGSLVITIASILSVLYGAVCSEWMGGWVGGSCVVCVKNRLYMCRGAVWGS